MSSYLANSNAVNYNKKKKKMQIKIVYKTKCFLLEIVKRWSHLSDNSGGC
jgi:hypothetical protein